MAALRALFVCLVLALFVSASATGSDWPTYQADSSHSGYVPIGLDPSKIALRWEKPAGNGQAMNPVAAGGGKIFVSTYGYFSNAGLFVYDAQTGAERWYVTYGQVFSVNPPAYAYGNVYIQTGNHATDTYLRAYDAASGDLVFQAAHAAQWERYYAPTIVDGTVYVDGGYYGGMYAFDAHDGTQRWFRGLQQYDQWTPAVDAQYAYAYLGAYSPALYAVDRATGNLAFSIPDPDFQWNGWSMNLAPVLGGDSDLFAIHDGRLIRFDLANRAIAWQLKDNFTGQPSVAKGVVYTVDSNALSVRDEVTGKLLWSWAPSTEKVLGPLLVTDTHVIVPCETTTHAVDLVTHKSEWSYPATGTVAVADGAIIIARTDGKLTVLDAVPPPDSDGDGVADRVDNCPTTANATQADRDGDGVGDACNDATDGDGDEWADARDNCPSIANADQSDRDHDGLGDVCDPYPDDANNDFAQCRDQRGTLQQQVEAVQRQLDEARSQLAQCQAGGGRDDADGDGEPDVGDACPGTPKGLPVDGSGCSRVQFCASHTITNFSSLARCALAQWPGEPSWNLDCRAIWSQGRMNCVSR